MTFRGILQLRQCIIISLLLFMLFVCYFTTSFSVTNFTFFYLTGYHHCHFVLCIFHLQSSCGYECMHVFVWKLQTDHHNSVGVGHNNYVTWKPCEHHSLLHDAVSWIMSECWQCRGLVNWNWQQCGDQRDLICLWNQKVPACPCGSSPLSYHATFHMRSPSKKTHSDVTIPLQI